MKTQIISSREREILQLISEELTMKEIAAHLYISQHTVISHRKNLLEKMEARNTAGLMVAGLRLGLIHI